MLIKWDDALIKGEKGQWGDLQDIIITYLICLNLFSRRSLETILLQNVEILLIFVYLYLNQPLFTHYIGNSFYCVIIKKNTTYALTEVWLILTVWNNRGSLNDPWHYDLVSH